jgi:hypothetical protein
MWRREGGMGFLGWILSIPFLLIGLLILGFVSTLINQAYWDYRVEEMCKKDGGRTIYEKVVLSDEEYGAMLDKAGYIHISSSKTLNGSEKYFYQYESEKIFAGILSLNVTKYSTRVIRREGKNVVAEQIRYGRYGGDFPFATSNGSSFICPVFEQELSSEVFFKN